MTTPGRRRRRQAAEAAKYPQLKDLACPTCGCTAGTRGATPFTINRKRVVVQRFNFECGNVATCSRDAPKVSFGKNCKRAANAEVDDELLAKALLMTARTKDRSLRRSPGESWAPGKTIVFVDHELPSAIERMWDVPVDHPWASSRQSWLNEARALKAAIARLKETKQ